MLTESQNSKVTEMLLCSRQGASNCESPISDGSYLLFDVLLYNIHLYIHNK